MTVARTRRGEKVYQKHMAVERPGCEFCQIREGDPQFVKAIKSFKVIHNLFPYAFWDDQRVTDHLLVVPKEHVESLASFDPGQAAEYLALISDYEANGYHVYARALKSISRSVAHQHTHLIKGEGKKLKVVLQVAKPHLLLLV